MTINQKLSTIQTKFKSKKSRFNSFGKYYFRSAEDILESIKPYLLEIGVAVTIRGNDAVVLLKRLLEAKGNTVNGKSFDNFGNYSFGINEHIDIPGVKYDPQIGILGLGISVTLTRPGYSIRKRSKHKASIGKSHVISNQEAKDYLAKEYGVTIA